MEASIRNYQCISCSILFRETVSPSFEGQHRDVHPSRRVPRIRLPGADLGGHLNHGRQNKYHNWNPSFVSQGYAIIGAPSYCPE